MWTQRNKETIRLASYGWAGFLGVFKLLRDRSARFARKRFYPVSCLGESSLILLSASCFSSFRSNILLFAPTETRSCRKLPEAHSIKSTCIVLPEETPYGSDGDRQEMACKYHERLKGECVMSWLEAQRYRSVDNAHDGGETEDYTRPTVV
ncbi:unnamed protein product [Ascophyllum nodosum]